MGDVEYMSEVEEDPEDLFVVKILSSKYDEIKPEQVVKSQKHLTVEQQKDLQQMLEKYPQLFNGRLKKYTGKDVTLTLKENAIPTQSRAYKIPFIHRKLFLEELEKLIKQGVLSKSERSLWSAPTFLIPK